NGGKNSLNRLIRCVCGKKIGPDPRNFNQRVNLGRNDLLIRTFPIYLSKEDHTNFPKINHNSSGIKNGIEVRKIRTVTDETLNTYKKSNLPDNPSSHNERIKVIISYFDSCHSLIDKNAK
ncbi:hypothetical protein V5021_24805, partial [Escherichia coli]